MSDWQQDVVSFQLAKQMTKAGIKGESYWHWVFFDGEPMLLDFTDWRNHEGKSYSAYTTGELGNMIRAEYYVEMPSMCMVDGKHKWEYASCEDGGCIHELLVEKEADARAMLLYGLKMGEIKISESVNDVPMEKPVEPVIDHEKKLDILAEKVSEKLVYSLVRQLLDVDESLTNDTDAPSITMSIINKSKKYSKISKDE